MKIQVALVQENPIFFDKQATLDKLEGIARKEAENGVDLILFPESFVPGYPRGFDFGARVGSRKPEGKALYARYHRESVDLGSEDRTRLEELARETGVFLAVGLTEKDSLHGSLFCSLLYISPEEGLLGVHRKIKPTGTERLIWAEAGGESLVAFDTPLGKLGGLICWENYMPLARMAMYQQGVQIYLAPTADARPTWTATMQHIALEGRCFVLGCNQYFTKSMYPAEFQPLVANEPEEMCPGGSVVVSPDGKILAGPLFGQAGVLRAELDLEEIIAQKLDFDPVGHYARPDVFRFEVRKERLGNVMR